MSFGRWGRMPLKFGSTQKLPTKVEYRALLTTLEPGYDSTEGTVHQVETFAHARVVGMVWGAGQRLANQAIPEKMMEELPNWEEILDLRPAPGTSDFERRAAVGARFRGLQNNALPDIEDVCAKVMGANFDAVVVVDPTDVVNYWPGGTPGPPSFEWCSNNATIAVRVNRTNLNDSEFLAKVARLREQLDRLLPSWCNFYVGVGSSFVVNASVVGIDLI